MELHLGRQLKKACIDVQITQTDLAKRLGRKPQSVARDFAKKDHSTKALRVYCETLGIDLRDLFKA